MKHMSKNFNKIKMHLKHVQRPMREIRYIISDLGLKQLSYLPLKTGTYVLENTRQMAKITESMHKFHSLSNTSKI